MIKIFQIDFSREVEIPPDDIEGLTEIEIEERTEVGTGYSNFHLGCERIEDALRLGSFYLEKEFEKDEYKIVSVTELEEIQIMNWPNFLNPFDVEDAPKEDVIDFRCSCGKEIKILDGWKTIDCPYCGKEIDRNSIIGDNGNYLLLDADNMQAKKKKGKNNSKNV
jgi:predicted RNA-binding Zn-ribbon protein involved in translation (DUF1610 family)